MAENINDTSNTKNTKTKVIKRRKISIQKIFSFVSAGFILACCIFYGTRFITLYLDNKKQEIESKNSLSEHIRNENSNNKNFKKIDNDYYFYGNTENNYVKYSNYLWRIVKINNDNSIKLISDDIVTYLANGNNKNWDDSYSNIWLNKKNNNDKSGIFVNSLNNPYNYLMNDSVCVDEINSLKNVKCSNIEDTNLIGLLSVFDYANAGGKNSYLNIGKYYYLVSTTNKNKNWYIDDEGNVINNDGDEIYGIRPTITLKSNSDFISGDGSEDNPYVIDENNLIGSFVKLDNDIWRIYQVNEDLIKLSLNDYLKINNEILEYNYSNKGYYHNDTIKGSLAYYLNNNFLNNLKYSQIIENNKWVNGTYGISNDYNYQKTLNDTVETKVSSLSVGDIFINNDLSDYYLSTGISKSSFLVYTVKDNGTLYEKNSTNTSYIVPTITINKKILTKGNGSIDNPFRME